MKKEIKCIKECLARLEEYVEELVQKNEDRELETLIEMRDYYDDEDEDMYADIDHETFRIGVYDLPVDIFKSLFYRKYSSHPYDSRKDGYAVAVLSGKIYDYEDKYEMDLDDGEWEAYNDYIKVHGGPYNEGFPMTAEVYGPFKGMYTLSWKK